MRPPPPSALALRAAMGPTPRRLNPTGPSWRLERRHAEGGPWFEADALHSLEGAREAARAPTFSRDYGDLVRLLSPKGNVWGFWVQGRSGLLDAGDVPAALGDVGLDWGLDWERAWEGRGAQAEAMLRVARGVDRRRMVLAACDCAETAVSRLSGSESRAAEALETARRWVRGGAELAEARRASFRAAALGDAAPASAPAVAAAAEAAASAASVVAFDMCEGAASAAKYAALAGRLLTGASPVQGARALAPLVRRWVPLPVVLLGRAKEPTPLELGF